MAPEIHVKRSARIAADRRTTFDAVSDVTRWPKLAASFRDTALLMSDGVRSLTETTSRHGQRQHRLVTFREAHAPASMTFEHLNPSRFFRRHCGVWNFEAEDTATRLTLTHRVVPRFVPGWLARPIVDYVVLGPRSAQMLEEMRQSIEALDRCKELTR